MRWCFICRTNTADTYWPSSCACLLSKRLINTDDEKSIDFKKFSDNVKEVLGYEPLNGDSYFDGFCRSCWERLFEPKYVPEHRQLFAYGPSGEAIPISTSELFVQRRRAPACPFCQTMYNVSNQCDSDEIDFLRAKEKHKKSLESN